MVKINGFEVAYSHRGSWKARRILRGQIVDDVPIAWDRDYSKAPGSAPSLIVWFESAAEAAERLDEGNIFVAALAKWTGGSGSSQNIKGLFNVQPVGSTADPKGILCTVLSKAEAP